MTDLEVGALLSARSLIDLNTLDEALRAPAWLRCAEHCFPGVSISNLCPNPELGLIAGSSFGSGRLWTIASPPVRVSYDPRGLHEEHAQIFSVMLQLGGATFMRQSDRGGALHPGELCVIDGARPFELEVAALSSHFMVLQIPRRAVLGRHPYLERRTAEAFDPHETGTTLLRGLLLNLLESADGLAHDQRGAALGAVIQLLGAPRIGEPHGRRGASWRVRAALALIDSELADPDLDAKRIAAAQRISRRRLDEIMVTAIGTPLTAHIWQRRLEQAASDLLEPKLAAKTVTQIAFAAGFEDAAHFTRAFKRRHRCTPSAWRRRHALKSQVPTVEGQRVS
ncbi:MAG: helix-turn-helix domain-containing protein [Steroidobacteraceae bacterium]